MIKKILLFLTALFIKTTPVTPIVQQFMEPSKPVAVAKHQIYLPKQEFQTFNNCGPTTLAMVLNWYGYKVTGVELGKQIRPYQNPKGNNDDKTVFAEEFAKWARKYGFNAIVRPAGTTDRLEALVAADIPVVVKTLLHTDDDIAHFRIITGYDQTRQVIVQDDSFEGKRREMEYKKLLQIWQPFNYIYVVVYRPDQEGIVKSILGTDFDEQTAWKSALTRDLAEQKLNPGSVYPVFDMAVVEYHLGDYKKSVEEYEAVAERLPRRTFWYQIEPIEAYFQLGNYPKVFELTDKILGNGDRAYSELYDLRSQAYAKMGEPDKAKAEYAKAIIYNTSYEKFDY